MAGVLFVVCIPTSDYEKTRRKREPKVMFNFNKESKTSLEKVAESNGELIYIDEKSDKGDVVVPESKTPTLLDLPDNPADGSMEEILDELLKKLKVENAVWCSDKIANYYQVFFSVSSAELCEKTLCHLHEHGIGLNLNSTISVIPCSLYYDGNDRQPSNDESVSEGETKKEGGSSTGWERFVASVGARLTVAQVVERVKADACLTFDFLVLLLIAAVVATLGLIENSTVMLVASMLISPLMGPIMAGTFGTVIEDRRLRKMGVLNELVGLFICLIVGFCIGLICGILEVDPTEEMLSRGRIRSLWVGALIALPSGAAVAIALLGDKTGSLVGVAISASILPPAVNAGLLWGLAFVGIFTQNPADEPTYVYTDDACVDLAALGAVSLCLTLVNIFCIFVVGIGVLKIKEVAPRTSGKQSQFWRHDIKIARDYNKTFNHEDGKRLQQQLAEELAGLSDADLTSHHISPERYRNISNRFVQNTWSPCAARDAQRMSVHDLEELYLNLKRSQSPNRRTSSWLPAPDPVTPAWYRNHHFSPPAALGVIREASGLWESLDGGMPKQRRMTYAHDDVSTKNPKRFLVSPVDEDSSQQ